MIIPDPCFCFEDKYLLASMIMLSAVCSWHAIVTTLLYDRSMADKVETIVLTVLGVVYLLFNVGFVIIIYLFVSALFCRLVYEIVWVGVWVSTVCLSVRL